MRSMEESRVLHCSRDAVTASVPDNGIGLSPSRFAGCLPVWYPSTHTHAILNWILSRHIQLLSRYRYMPGPAQHGNMMWNTNVLYVFIMGSNYLNDLASMTAVS